MAAPARTETLSPAVAAWLVTPDGLAAIADVTAALDGGHDDLTVAASLRERLSPERAVAVQASAHARQRARARWPDADRLLFTPAALEQASDPVASAWRAERFAAADHVVDLCSGAGGDALALAEIAEVTAVDRDLARLCLARHNAGARAVPVRPVAGDALAPPVRLAGPVHCDPGRRADGRRLRRLGDYHPPVDAVLAATAQASGTAIVCSPAVDLDDPALPDEAELEFVQLGDDLIEAVLWTGEFAAEARASATLLPDRVRRSRRGPPEELPVGAPGGWLVTVAPAAVRARCHDEVGAEIGAWRLARRRALLTCDDPPAPSPWYAARHIEAQLPVRAKQIRRWLQAADERPVEIAVHGLDVAPERLWQALGRPPRGPMGWRLELVRTDTGGTCLVTSDERAA